jgi:hypothetical protein
MATSSTSIMLVTSPAWLLGILQLNKYNNKTTNHKCQFRKKKYEKNQISITPSKVNNFTIMFSNGSEMDKIPYK